MEGQFTEADEHKPVFDQTGERVGTVARVEEGTAYIDVEPTIRDVVKRSLGFEAVDEDHTYPIGEDMIATVTDREIRLREVDLE